MRRAWSAEKWVFVNVIYLCTRHLYQCYLSDNTFCIRKISPPNTICDLKYMLWIDLILSIYWQFIYLGVKLGACLDENNTHVFPGIEERHKNTDCFFFLFFFKIFSPIKLNWIILHSTMNKMNMLMSSLQLSGFVEKYTGSGMNLHPQSSSNKDNRRTEGLNRYLKTLQSNESTAPG